MTSFVQQTINHKADLIQSLLNIKDNTFRNGIREKYNLLIYLLIVIIRLLSNIDWLYVLFMPFLPKNHLSLQDSEAFFSVSV